MFVGQGILIGRIADHEIRIDPMAFGILALYAFFQIQPPGIAIAFILAAFFSILIHELGHAFAIGRLLHEGSEVTIGFGGVTRSFGARTARQQFLISIAGPFAGVALGVAAWGVAGVQNLWFGPLPWDVYRDSPPTFFLFFTIWMSAAWGILNLLPVVPLDGGQALRALLIDRGMHRGRARRFTRRLSMVVAAAAAIYFLQADELVGTLVMVWILFENYEETRIDGW
jgi:Zn-dependent protease